MHQWHVYPDFETASRAAADFIASQIRSSIEQRGVCHVALPGGNSPLRCFAHLVSMALPWDRVHWYPGDERCYPRGHAERNDLMLARALWSQLEASHVHVIPAELGPEAAATAFAQSIAEVERFDLAFLGMGEDGHTASLFPGNPALQDTRRVVPVYHSPKPPDERVSLSVTTLQQARARVVVAGGQAKAPVIARIRAGESLPINSLGDIHWYLDADAAAEGND
ncbi:MAG: 6-phosphogluconolactonase [Gammaproteobacteria bacterium]